MTTQPVSSTYTIYNTPSPETMEVEEIKEAAHSTETSASPTSLECLLSLKPSMLGIPKSDNVKRKLFP